MSPLADMFNSMGDSDEPHVEMHVIPMGGGPMGMMGGMNSLGDFLRNMHRTGPVAEHRMGPIFPTNILTPGAHPAHADNKPEEKNEAEKKNTDDKKKDAKKEETKPKESDDKGKK